MSLKLMDSRKDWRDPEAPESTSVVNAPGGYAQGRTGPVGHQDTLAQYASRILSMMGFSSRKWKDMLVPCRIHMVGLICLSKCLVNVSKAVS